MNRKTIITACLLSVLTLSACAHELSRPEKIAIWTERCQGYGFKPGTEGMANCIAQQEIAVNEHNRAIIDRHFR